LKFNQTAQQLSKNLDFLCLSPEISKEYFKMKDWNEMDGWNHVFYLQFHLSSTYRNNIGTTLAQYESFLNGQSVRKFERLTNVAATRIIWP
jgi:peroxiredoxin